MQHNGLNSNAMKTKNFVGLFLLAIVVVSQVNVALGAEGVAGFFGWRGNGTGLFPGSTAPVQWSRVSTGPMGSMKSATTQPADGSDQDAVSVDGGLVSGWLVIGPLKMEDPAKDFDKPQIADEAEMAPRNGDKARDLAWRFVKPVDDGGAFLYVDPLGAKFQARDVGYAYTCLYAAKAGTIRAVVEHNVGMKMYVNGKQVYADPQPRAVMGSVYASTSHRIASTWPKAPSFEFDVRQGWNRVTVKLVAPPVDASYGMNFAMRLMDVPDVRYEQKNIVWMTPLPDQSTATPIIVGDRIFVMAEPDELICIDKNSGKILWNATNNWYDATRPAEKDANPAFKDTIEPIAKALVEWKDPYQRVELRKKLMDALVAVDKVKYTTKWDAHYQAHFGIIGFTTTPTSDGKYVYVWTGAGVAACYDLDGRRQWITRIDGKLYYAASPAVCDGKMAVLFEQLRGLDARTGQVIWQNEDFKPGSASLMSARLAGADVFVTQHGSIVRPSDGKTLWLNPDTKERYSGAPWGSPTILGDEVYLHWYTLGWLFKLDWAGNSGDAWTPKITTIRDIGAGVAVKPNPLNVGHNTACSPLIYDGLMYGMDWVANYCVVDLKTGKTLAYKDFDAELKGEVNYNSIRIAASPTLIGKNIVLMDNQGHALALEPGKQCKVAARSFIGTQIQRDWPETTQEYIGYSPPVADGTRIYIRGERHLYCIGEK